MKVTIDVEFVGDENIKTCLQGNIDSMFSILKKLEGHKKNVKDMVCILATISILNKIKDAVKE